MDFILHSGLDRDCIFVKSDNKWRNDRCQNAMSRFSIIMILGIASTGRAGN